MVCVVTAKTVDMHTPTAPNTCNQHHILFEPNGSGDWVAEDTVCGQEIRGSVWYCCKEHRDQRVTPDLTRVYVRHAEDIIMND